MRELKFRVWSEDQKTYDYKFPYNSIGDFYVSTRGKVFSDFGNTVAPEVRQEAFIVEQYTGLKDKNGVEIYEGDIIKVVNVHDGDDECWEQPFGPAIPQEVKWNEELLRWSFGGCRRILCVPEDFEVIGNIHENPELLEGE